MVELAQDITDFLKDVSNANTGNDRVDGHPAEVHKTIGHNKEHELFRVSKGYSIQYMTDGRSASQSYFFREEEFLPLVERLRETGVAELSHETVRTSEYDRWDHSYGQDDSGGASVQAGRVTGRLRLEDKKFVEFEINFEPRGEKTSVKSDASAFDHEEFSKHLNIYLTNYKNQRCQK